MEFYLAKEVEATLEVKDYGQDFAYSKNKRLDGTLELCGRMSKQVRDNYRENLSSLLGIDPAEVPIPPRTSPFAFNLSGRISPMYGVNTKYYAEGKGGQMDLRCFTSGNGTLFHKVFKTFFNEETGTDPTCNAAIRVKVELFAQQTSLTIASKDFQIIEDSEGEGSWYGVTVNLGAVPDKITLGWTSDDRIRGIFTVILVLNDNVTNRLLIHNLFNSTFSFALKEMLEDEDEADTEVVSGEEDAMPVKCHRAFLACRSPVFKAMFKSGMKEANTNSIHVPEMKLSELRAFIKYMYTGDLRAPLSDCCLALEMLRAGDCYQVTDLFLVISDLMFMKPDEWFSVDVAVDLLVFAVRLCGGANSVSNEVNPGSKKDGGILDKIGKKQWEELKLRAVQVLKWYSIAKPMDLMSSERYKDLHEKKPEIAMELHACFLRYLDMDAMRGGTVG